MKRKTTDLETRLIKDEWYLESKRYSGKHSEKTKCYVYRKTIEGNNNVIILDKKRNKIVKYGIDNINIDFVDKETLYYVHKAYLELKEYVQTLTPLDEPIPNELLESVE